jgi:hypothetical protein
MRLHESIKIITDKLFLHKIIGDKKNTKNILKM